MMGGGGGGGVCMMELTGGGGVQRGPGDTGLEGRPGFETMRCIQ